MYTPNFLTYTQDDLHILIGNTLDAFDKLDPARIIVKSKLHILIHIESDIRRLGPAVRFSTEIFECFNAVFRMCSVLSNHQAPSRDIAYKLADLDRVKHILGGGFWLEGGVFIQAGKDVRGLMTRSPIIQRHLGWTPPRKFTPGSVKPQVRAKLRELAGADTLAAHAVNIRDLADLMASTQWTDGIQVTAHSGDVCSIGSWVVATSGSVSAACTALLCEIIDHL